MQKCVQLFFQLDKKFCKVFWKLSIRRDIPFFSDFIDINYIVRLSNYNFCRIRRKSYSFDNVTLFTILKIKNVKTNSSQYTNQKSFVISNTLESTGFVENLSFLTPLSSNKKIERSLVATANFKPLGDHAKETILFSHSC